MKGNYTGLYELNGGRDTFFFSVQGANISVIADLDKKLYEENETAILTLNVTNTCPFTLSLYARVKLNDYEEIEYFDLIDKKTLQFFVPIQFNGHKLFYGIYMASGRALHLNALYIYEKNHITLYTDKQVYTIGDTVSIFVETNR